MSQYVFVLFLKFSLATQIREAVKKRVFYGQADREGGVTAPILTVSKCENFGPIFPIIK